MSRFAKKQKPVPNRMLNREPAMRQWSLTISTELGESYYGKLHPMHGEVS